MRMHVYLTGLVVAMLGLGVARSQGPTYPGNRGSTLPPSVSPGESVPPTANNNGANGRRAANNNAQPQSDASGYAPVGGPPVYGPGLSEWLVYPRGSECCGPVGKHGEIRTETYARTGVSFPTGGGLVGDNATPGYWVQGGLRTLLFNTDRDAAWVIDGGLSGAWYDIRHAPLTNLFGVQVSRPSPQGQVLQSRQDILTVIPSSVSYTLLDLSVGREYYLWGGPDCSCESRFRIGWDFGGRYGTSKMIAVPIAGVIFDPNQRNQNGQDLTFAPGDKLKHRVDVVGGYFLSLHGDLEVPTGCCVFFVGARLEYGALWSDILQRQNDTNVQLFNALVNFGLRF